MLHARALNLQMKRLNQGFNSKIILLKCSSSFFVVNRLNGI